MNVEEFRTQTRANLEQTLNHLQTATLLIAELDVQIAEAGRTVQTLSQIIEEFADQQAIAQPTPSQSDRPQPVEPNGEPELPANLSD